MYVCMYVSMYVYIYCVIVGVNSRPKKKKKSHKPVTRESGLACTGISVTNSSSNLSHLNSTLDCKWTVFPKVRYSLNSGVWQKKMLWMEFETLSICMYICMWQSICVFMYVRMYICMYVCMYVRKYDCMYVCMYVCMYACMYIDEGRLPYSTVSIVQRETLWKSRYPTTMMT